MRKLYYSLGVAGLCLFLCGATCQNNNQASYQSIGATEQLVLAANHSYLTAVVTGQAPTNSVPVVEAAFNDVQLSLYSAAAISSGGTNAPVPAALSVKANSFISLATTASTKK